MKITDEEIALVGLCSVANVKKARQRGRLEDTLSSVLGFVLASRAKELGLGFMDALGVDVKPAADLHYEPDHEHTEW